MKRHEQFQDNPEHSVEHLKSIYSDIFTVLSPPRCGSTAFSRAFWEQPSVSYYSHEPFEVTYFLKQGMEQVYDKLLSPLDIKPLKNTGRQQTGNALVIKDMPYQIGDNFDTFLALTTKPVVVLVRDPRLSIYSRMQKKREAGQNPIYPLVETGWQLLDSQIKVMKERKVPYLVVETTDYRNEPVDMFNKLFSKLGLPFDPTMLNWKPAEGVDVDNLNGRHRHQYSRALLSNGIQPATESMPSIDDFPVEGGFRNHIEYALSIYESLKSDFSRINVIGTNK